MARVLLDTIVPEDRAGAPLIERQSTAGEVLQAQFEEGIEAGETSSIIRSAKLKFSEEDDDVVNHAELNKMFPNIEVPFNEPTSLSRAKEVMKRTEVRAKRRNIIANGDPDSVMLKVASFGANLIPQALDPVGLAAGLLVGGGVTKAMGLISKAGKFGQLAVKSNIARRAAEGVAGNLLAEAAFVQPASRLEQADVDTYESLTNAIAAGVLFPVVIGGAKKSIDFLRRGRTSDLKMQKSNALVEAQAQMGIRPDLESYITAEKKAALPEMREELDLLRKDKVDPEIIARAEEEISDIEALTPVDRAVEAEKMNAREAQLYHDPEADTAFEVAVRDLEPAERSTEIKQNFDELSENIKDLESQGLVSEAVKKEFGGVAEEFNAIDKIDQMIKAATLCVRGS